MIDAKVAPKKPVSSDAQATRIDRPVIRAEPKKGVRQAPSEAKTRLDNPAIKDDGSLSPRRSTPKMSNPPKMVTPGQSPPSDQEKEASTAQPATAEAESAAAPNDRAQRGQKGFSETQWFMKGIEVDADLLEMVDDEEYDRDENITEKARKGFTLRREDEG